MISVTIPIRTSNPLNGSHGHWSKLANMRKKQRMATRLALGPHYTASAGIQFEIVLTRLAPSKGLDFDGLTAALKSIRDGIADWLGFRDDSDPCLRWWYAQDRDKNYGVRIEIETR